MSEDEVVIPPEAYEGDVKPRDLGPMHKLLLEIHHPQDDNPQYVIKVIDPDTGNIYGTLFTSEQHVIAGFGNFMANHLKSNNI